MEDFFYYGNNIKRVGVLWCLTLLSTIFQLYRIAVSFIGGGNRSTRKNHCPVTSHWQALSYNVVSSTHRLSGLRTHNVSVDRH